MLCTSSAEGCVVELLQHPLRDVDGDELPHARGERESEEPGARAEVDHVVVAPRLRELDDPVANREKGLARGDLLPGLDALVPAVGIAHKLHRYCNA